MKFVVAEKLLKRFLGWGNQDIRLGDLIGVAFGTFRSDMARDIAPKKLNQLD